MDKVLPPVGRGGTPVDVFRQVGRCRVLVTNAYHLAVFALSQGIPAVGITASEYYDDNSTAWHRCSGADCAWCI
ncbi:polysaccharide pyruvyl transferase family protein [Nocardia sp. NPDC050412]|uniref:polysaccharide pyruvyl transferase family protein n=1 Tax=Nocardia sp. NPDC050412 TaxID=3364320 RepID=UPI0037BA7F29